MYLIVIYSFIITAFVAIVLHHVQKSDDVDSTKNKKSLIVTSFFLFIVLLIGFHLLGFGSKELTNSLEGGNNKIEYEKQMVQNIHQSMHTGFAPF
jgi:Na+/proline symporter